MIVTSNARNKQNNRMSHLKAIEKAVIKAGKILARDFGEVENLQVSQKGPGNFVTSSDLKVERILIDQFQEMFPKYTIISEERGLIEGEDDKYTIIIDPIDGTTNFMHALPFFCISVALREKLDDGTYKIVCGVTYAPALNELFMAEEGSGAYLNDQRIEVSARNDYDDCLFAGYVAKYNGEQRKSDLQAFVKLRAQTRIIGSAALEMAYVAAGKLDGMWHCNLKLWDIAAGSLLVKESRGMISEINGGDKYLDSGNIVVANSNVFEKLRERLVQCY